MHGVSFAETEPQIILTNLEEGSMFEQEVKKYLTSHNEPFTDGTSSHNALDFHLTRHNIHIDAKEKLQKFSIPLT